MTDVRPAVITCQAQDPACRPPFSEVLSQLLAGAAAARSDQLLQGIGTPSPVVLETLAGDPIPSKTQAADT